MVERAGMITNRIKEHRARFDLKQEELARRVGVRRATIGHLEKGRYNLPWRGMNSIRRSLRGLEHVLE